MDKIPSAKREEYNPDSFLQAGVGFCQTQLKVSGTHTTQNSAQDYNHRDTVNRCAEFVSPHGPSVPCPDSGLIRAASSVRWNQESNVFGLQNEQLIWSVLRQQTADWIAALQFCSHYGTLVCAPADIVQHDLISLHLPNLCDGPALTNRVKCFHERMSTNIVLCRASCRCHHRRQRASSSDSGGGSSRSGGGSNSKRENQEDA